MVKFAQARRSRSSSGQRIDRSALEFPHERPTVGKGSLALPGGQVTVTGSRLAVLGRARAVLGGLDAELRGAFALPGGTRDELHSRQHAPVLGLRGRGVELCHRKVTGVGGLVARERGEIPEVRDRIALLGDAQTLPSVLIALTGGALPDITAEFVRSPAQAGHEVLIAGGLVAIGGKLVALRARLISVSRCLVGVRERLVRLAGGLGALGKRLLIALGKRGRPRWHAT